VPTIYSEHFMRFLVLLLGLLGSGLAGAFGYLVLSPGSGQELLRGYVPGMSAPSDIFMAANAGYFLLIGAILGIFGSILAFFRCGPQGGVLMLVSLTGPAICLPQSLFGTALLGISGILSFFVRPLPLPPPVDE
jgi:hypothetical protein